MHSINSLQYYIPGFLLLWYVQSYLFFPKFWRAGLCLSGWEKEKFHSRLWRRQWQPTPVLLPGKIPRTEESVGSLRVRHNWTTSLSLFTFTYWRRKRQHTPVFLPGESQGLGSLVGCRLWGCRVRHDWSNLAAVSYDQICGGKVLLQKWNGLIYNGPKLETTHMFINRLMEWKTAQE